MTASANSTSPAISSIEPPPSAAEAAAIAAAILHFDSERSLEAAGEPEAPASQLWRLAQGPGGVARAPVAPGGWRMAGLLEAAQRWPSR